MRPLFTTILLLLSVIAISKDKPFSKPDYNSIEKEIKTSENYYPSLYSRYVMGDTTLTLGDYRVLYYGFVFSESYSPYGNSSFSDSTAHLLKKDTLTFADYKELIRFEENVVADFPFNLRDLDMLSQLYYQIGDTLISKQIDYRISMIMAAILSTGTGMKEKTAWHVISISHEYDILSLLGFQPAGSQTLTKKRCDYLEVVPNEHNVKGFYFDVNVLFSKMKF